MGGISQASSQTLPEGQSQILLPQATISKEGGTHGTTEVNIAAGKAKGKVEEKVTTKGRSPESFPSSLVGI